MYDSPSHENLCKSGISKFPRLCLPSVKKSRLPKFSHSGTVLFLNSGSIKNQGQLNALPAVFTFQESSFDGHTAKFSS